METPIWGADLWGLLRPRITSLWWSTRQDSPPPPPQAEGEGRRETEMQIPRWEGSWGIMVESLKKPNILEWANKSELFFKGFCFVLFCFLVTSQPGVCSGLWKLRLKYRDGSDSDVAGQLPVSNEHVRCHKGAEEPEPRIPREGHSTVTACLSTTCWQVNRNINGFSCPEVELKVGTLIARFKGGSKVAFPQIYCQKHFSNHFSLGLTVLHVKRGPQNAILGDWKEYSFSVLKMT